jgi:hypothetical protein
MLLVGTIIAAGLVGAIVMISARAAGNFVAAEPENGTASNSATVVADTTASGQKAVKFGLGQLRGVGFAAPSLPSQSATVQAAWLDDMKSMGISWVRFDIDWWTVQPNNATTFNWAPYDQTVAAAKARGIKVLGTIAYTPPWARSSECPTDFRCHPASSAAYATYAKAVVQHFGPDMPAVEIWNEPNFGFWQPKPDPVQYVDLLKQAYTAIKTISQSVVVMTGGTAPACTCGTDVAPIDFVTALYANGAKNYFDALAHHPYSYPAPPDDPQSWSGWSQMNDTNPSIRSVMSANGDGNKPLWMTETGAPTNGPQPTATCTDYHYELGTGHVDECLQAKMIQEEVDYNQSFPWAGPVFIYSYKDNGTDTSTTENFFGILRADGSRKPSYTSLKNAISN